MTTPTGFTSAAAFTPPITGDSGGIYCFYKLATGAETNSYSVVFSGVTYNSVLAFVIDNVRNGYDSSATTAAAGYKTPTLTTAHSPSLVFYIIQQNQGSQQGPIMQWQRINGVNPMNLLPEYPQFPGMVATDFCTFPNFHQMLAGANYQNTTSVPAYMILNSDVGPLPAGVIAFN